MLPSPRRCIPLIVAGGWGGSSRTAVNDTSGGFAFEGRRVVGGHHNEVSVSDGESGERGCGDVSNIDRLGVISVGCATAKPVSGDVGFGIGIPSQSDDLGRAAVGN